jgi:hypothetical protein
MVIFSSCFCIVVSIPVVALRANRTDEVAALVQLSGIPFRAIAPKIGHPFTYLAAVEGFEKTVLTAGHNRHGRSPAS